MQYGIGFSNFFEALCGARLLVSIRVIPERKAAKDVLDGLGIRIARYAKDFVIIPLLGQGRPPSCLHTLYAAITSNLVTPMFQARFAPLIQTIIEFSIDCVKDAHALDRMSLPE
jgi:hypothetical protein